MERPDQLIGGNLDRSLRQGVSDKEAKDIVTVYISFTVEHKTLIRLVLHLRKFSHQSQKQI